MGTFSINTNYAASIALQQLTKTSKELEESQSRINTGLKVSSAKDNGAVFAIAQGQRADVAGYGVVQQSLDRVSSVADVALSAGEAISDLMIQMREKAVAAKDSTLTDDQRDAYNEDFVALRKQLKAIVDNAEFNGFNLINGDTDIIALANADGSNTITVGAENMSLEATTPADWSASTAIVRLAEDDVIDSAANAGDVLTRLDVSIANVSNSLARLGSSVKAVEIHSSFITKLNDALENGIGNLVDADLAKESARLQSLQTKQQLGVQALSIANAAPQVINSLFR